VRQSLYLGGASGFWGDSSIALPQLLRAERLDFIVFDYLAEVTMAILARARESKPELGYATDFVAQLGEHLQIIADRGIRIVTNAGGMNPAACAAAIRSEIAKRGLPLKVGVVEGDNVLEQVERLRTAGVQEMFTGAALPASPLSANAYLGAAPIAAALAAGAHIVITGRCVDSALVLGPCLHEFQWNLDDWDSLAGGSLAGHLIECGAQVSGGIFTDWDSTGDWADIGYPISQVFPDGSCVLSKVSGTGGLISTGTVAEQLVYEIGDPQNYLLPDVVCDFTRVQLEQLEANVVRVSGARGRAPSSSYKASITYEDGYRLGAIWTIIGEDARLKAAKVADAVLRRVSSLCNSSGLAPFSATDVEILGSEASFGAQSRMKASREVLLKIAASHQQKAALSLLLREFTSAGTSMAPGFTGLGGHRPKPMPMIRLASCLIDKRTVSPVVSVDGASVTVPENPSFENSRLDTRDESPPTLPCMRMAGETRTIPLRTLALGRSGDKGNNANIGIIARDASLLPYIWEQVSAEFVLKVFAHYAPTKIERFLLPGIGAMNLLLHDCLGGGGTASLRNDPQGKGFAQILLDACIQVPAELAQRTGS
jgi:hypothetical protein